MTRIWDFSTADYIISQIYTRLACSYQRKTPQAGLFQLLIFGLEILSFDIYRSLIFCLFDIVSAVKKSFMCLSCTSLTFSSFTRSWFTVQSQAAHQQLCPASGTAPSPAPAHLPSAPPKQNLSPPAAFQQHFLPLTTQSLLHLSVWIMLDGITQLFLFSSIFLLSAEQLIKVNKAFPTTSNVSAHI